MLNAMGSLFPVRLNGNLQGSARAREVPVELYRILVDAVVDYAIFALDLEGRVLTWNRGAERLKGYRAEEIIGQHFSRFYPAEEAARGHPKYELETALRTGKYEEEGWRIRKDGSQFWANVVITRFNDATGQPLGFTKVTRDLTARKLADENLRLSEERYRLLVKSVRDYAILHLDPEGKIVTWDEGAERLKGYQAEEIIGRHFSIFYTREDIESGKADLELRTAAADGRFEDEGWRIRKDGSKFWANVILSAMRDSTGKLIGFSKVTRDLTERKRAEEELLRAYASLERRVEERTAELKAAVETRDRFLSIASHELKTPLSTLKLQTQLRRRNLEKGRFEDCEPERFAKLIDDDERQLNRIIRLVEDMLDIARLERGKFELRTEKFDLVELTREVIGRLKDHAEAAGSGLSLVAVKPVLGEWDRFRLEQVLVNLLTNAVKYGRGKPITVQVENAGAAVTLAVNDQGFGIAAEDHERIFQQFERVTSSHFVSGLGLGLYIAAQIVYAHGGEIEVNSTLGEGAVFTVRLPRECPRKDPEGTL